MIMAITARQWSGLVKVLALEDAISEIEARRGVSFARDEGVRFAHRDVLFPLVERAVSEWEYPALAQALDAVGGCYGPYQTMLDAAHDPVLVGGNPIFAETANPSGFGYPAAGAFATIPQLDRGAPRPAPQLGQHTDEVLATALGMADSEIGSLHDCGLIHQA
jgi:2-methylfumaryl-CoA isomerase